MLDGKSDVSITEVEMLHGALNDPSSAQHTRFYFRDPAYVLDKPDQFKLTCLTNSFRWTTHQGLRTTSLWKLSGSRWIGWACFNDFAQIIMSYIRKVRADTLDKDALDHDFLHTPAIRFMSQEMVSLNGLPTMLKPPIPPYHTWRVRLRKSALLATGYRVYRIPDGKFVYRTLCRSDPIFYRLVSMVRRILGEIKRRYAIPTTYPPRQLSWNPHLLTGSIWLRKAPGIKSKIILSLMLSTNLKTAREHLTLHGSQWWSRRT